MTVELAIVGAGPAGMAAAVLAGELGLDTVLLDEQSSPGGQIYRAIERARPTLRSDRIILPAGHWRQRSELAASTTGRIPHCGMSTPTARCSWKMPAAPRP